MASEPTVEQQLRSASAVFQECFGRAPRYAATAPGRVNLIGEHTDYNDGFVLPMAIERQTVIVADRSPRGVCRVISRQQSLVAEFINDESLRPGEPSWANYIKGVVSLCRAGGLDAGNFDAVVDSTVPLGGGLSSSAALEVATATLIETMMGRKLDPTAKALLCQKAEHTFAGMPCGIMDQFISTLAQAGAAMLLDCRSYQPCMTPLADPEVAVLIANTNVKHELTGSEYKDRRSQCEQAARLLGVKALRDATMSQLDAARSRLDATAFKRARHVIGENDRALRFADARAAGQWSLAGQLMYQSHESLAGDYEVSCPELDAMVKAASQLGESAGVFGSRMTGGGFGGCTVSLVRADHVKSISSQVHRLYQQATAIAPTIFATRPAGGARALDVR